MTTQVWMAQDPDTGRISMQDRDFVAADFPRGSSVPWSRRTGFVDEVAFETVLRGDQVIDADQFHQDAWAGGSSVG